MHRVDVDIEALAATQAGRFTRAQVGTIAAAGSSAGDGNGAGAVAKSLITRRLRSGRWRRLTSRVLCLPGAATSPAGALWTVHLHTGGDSVVGRMSAADLHGFPNIGRPTPTLLVPRGSHRRTPGAQLVQVGDLLPEDVVVLRGLPVTTVARTIVDLGRVASVPRLDQLLDHATTHRIVTIEELIALVDRVRRPGKEGLAPVIAALSKRLPGKGVEQGALERGLTTVVRLAGIPDGVAQYPHPGRCDSLELVDRALVEARLIIECDGRRWHDRITAERTDRRRDLEAATQGWQTVRLTWDDVHLAPEITAAQLRTIYRTRCVMAGVVPARADGRSRTRAR